MPTLEEDDSDSGEMYLPPVPGPMCWRCKEPHSAPAAIYRCEKCGRALCLADLYVNGGGLFPYTHRLEPTAPWCGPASVIGEATEATR